MTIKAITEEPKETKEPKVAVPAKKATEEEKTATIVPQRYKSIIAPLKCARVPLIWVQTDDEVLFMQEELRVANSEWTFYSCDATGIMFNRSSMEMVNNFRAEVVQSIRWFGRKNEDIREADGMKKPKQKLQDIVIANESSFYGEHANVKPPKDGSILFYCDIPSKLVDSGNVKWTNPMIAREIKNLIPSLMQSKRTMIIISHTAEIPPELASYCALAIHERPGIEHMRAMVESIGRATAKDTKVPPILLDSARVDHFAHMVIGMNDMEAENCLTLANWTNMQNVLHKRTSVREFDSEIIQKEKAICIRRVPSLELVQSKGSLNDVGGMDVLKKWFRSRIPMFNPEAQNRGIESPKGVVLVGPGGTGNIV